MTSGKYNSVNGTIGTIDITPLMDLTFMLLIIFIITVPALEFTTEVSPPEMNTTVTLDEINNKVMLTMNEKGEVQLNERTIAMSALEEELSAVFKAQPDMALLIMADGTRPYEDVIALHRAAGHVGIKNVHLVTTAEGD
ncbi:MAG: biopolymer transporter ExbD [Lentisphaeria bacterium]|nr:biopolymer transporter ExbD [Victivallales bacterium]MBR6059325.1 biopolymer transporter ExbD [Victivallales bacterium]MCR4574314.1 biopolymer transporter ExbD [Lentisphaeria bacterium]